MISSDYYTELIKAETQQEMGNIMGRAQSDREVKPDDYNLLCIAAKKKGFKFVNIEVVPN